MAKKNLSKRIKKYNIDNEVLQIKKEKDLIPCTSEVLCILIEKISALSSRVENLEDLMDDLDFLFNK